MHPTLTLHARSRAWQRFGWDLAALEARAGQALRQSCGIAPDLPSAFKARLKRLLLKAWGQRVAVRALDGVLFIFRVGPKGLRLLTLYALEPCRPAACAA